MACMFPYSVSNPLYGLPNQEARIPVPCGRCPACIKRRVAQWSFRLQEEEKYHDTAYFVTLTYENPPLSPNGLMTLRKRDVQLFFKRLRKKHPKGHVIKYYVAGEYGTRYGRPHYHIILFGAIQEHIVDSWQGQQPVDKDTGSCDILCGHVDIGTVTGASIGYTLKYLAKGKIVPAHERDDRVPEYSVMSLGLGKQYLEKKPSRGIEPTIHAYFVQPVEALKQLCRAIIAKRFGLKRKGGKQD